MRRLPCRKPFRFTPPPIRGRTAGGRPFGSDELDHLVDEALAGNFDVRTARARLAQADAVARQAGADLMPSVEYNGGTAKSWQQTKADDAGTSRSENNSFTAGLGAAYELDLWGRLDALRQSESFALEASVEDLQAAAVTVSAETTTAWIDILAVRQQIAILEDQIAMNERMLKLQELRFVNGRADALDISQQREALASARANLPGLQLAEQQQRNALTVLLGRAGTGDLDISQIELPDPIALPAAGLPADLLAARPDVRAAGLRLHSADWQISAARADRLPAITLSAETAFSSDALDLLFSNWVSTLAASLSGPLFDAGARAAEVDRTRAVAEESLTAYAQTVAEAIQEVEDSLVTETRQQEYIDRLEDQLAVITADPERRPPAVHEWPGQLPRLPDRLDQRADPRTAAGGRAGHLDQEPGDPLSHPGRRLDACPGRRQPRHRCSAGTRRRVRQWITAILRSQTIWKHIPPNHPSGPRLPRP